MTDWAIPQQAKLKYTQLFNFHDRSRCGFLSGLQCRDILLQSGLPRNVLAEIWNLSDIDGDGQLTREEFILAMHLTNQVRTGNSLPTELPTDLVPPSFRRTRSISTTSVHSSASIGSSVSGNNDDQGPQKSTENATPGALTSVLNSHTFEDKRRENYEKGRAELERRRLRIIEEQSSIIREQLTKSKKQVADAKAKIDSMRAERDSKMGMITSLEAQLKTLRDRKIHLAQDELQLIAIAHDLSLITPTQKDLDHLLTQPRQEELNQMRLKLNQMLEEKENKTVELSELTGRLEESRKELSSLTGSADEAYKTYKEKIADARALKEQLIEENKNKTVDLGSVWDSTPSFSSPANQNEFQDDSIIPSILTAASPKADDDPWSISNSQKKSFIAQSTNFESNFPTDTNRIANLDDGFKDLEISGPAQKRKQYKALYAFEARNPDELTMNPGDIIVSTDVVCDPGWLSGEINGKVGLFPEAYVEPFVEDETVSQVLSNNIPVVASELNKQTESFSTSTTEDSVTRYKVIYSFEARNSDELTINPGDIVTGFDGAHEPGWLLGELNGQKGLFPESYVEKLGESVQEPNAERGKSKSKRAEVATVIANYRALGQEQLNLEKGQLVMIRRKMDSGWWEGEIQVKGKKKQFGWFPASYVKLLSNSSGSTSANPID